jgi:predicted nucleic acid-binding protein
MKTFLLDTSALLTLRDDEPGADEVAALMRQAQRGEVNCHGCFISLMEVFYRVWKDEEASAGRLAYRQCQSLPMTWIHETPALLEKAAELKARYPISLADAWIAAAALLEQADLVHKDPEFEVIAVPQLRLPYQ